MKSLLIILALSLSMGAMASETGSRNGVPYTVGPLGYTDPFYTSQWSAQTVVGTTAAPTATSVLTSVSAQLKALAHAVENDAQNYLQTGEMSEILGHTVNNVLVQNDDLSVEDAVSVVLEFAAIHTK